MRAKATSQILTLAHRCGVCNERLLVRSRARNGWAVVPLTKNDVPDTSKGAWNVKGEKRLGDEYVTVARSRMELSDKLCGLSSAPHRSHMGSVCVRM